MMGQLVIFANPRVVREAGFISKSGDRFVANPCGRLVLPPEERREFDNLAERALASRAAFEAVDPARDWSSDEDIECLLADAPISEADLLQITRDVVAEEIKVL